MTDVAEGGPKQAVVHAPAIEAHRLIGDGRAAALILPDATLDWWCAPDFDSPPLLWWLLDVDGAVARWCGGRMVRRDERPAGPSARTTVSVGGRHVDCWDGLVAGTNGRGSRLVRLVRAVSEPVTLEHDLRLGGLDGPAAEWRGAAATIADVAVAVGGGRSTADGEVLRTQVEAVPGRWTGFAVGVDGEAGGDGDEMAAALASAEAEVEAMMDGCRLPRHHPERGGDALLVLNTCTYEPTGAVVASPTTSLPEVLGGASQWDYRYTWLRDASLAVSVAALLGRRDAADRYLRFVHAMTKARKVPSGPFTDIRGGTVPDERDLQAAGWAGSRPVRVGNGAKDQVQYDSLGLLLQAVSVYLQTGGSLDPATWDLVRSIAEELAGDVDPVTNGIWEFREPLALVDADIGRWLALDVALWIARLRHPLTKRRHWKRARDAARARVVEAIRTDGGLPQAYEGASCSDASSLMIPVFALLGRGDSRAHRLVDSVRRDLGAWPFLYRFAPEQPGGREGAFLPVSWWAVTALAVLGRYDEARELADEMCARLPRLLAEEIDPESGRSLGNTPLVWSHMEAARAMYVLDAARIRHRRGRLALTAWRLTRYVQLRWLSRSDAGEEQRS